jgi:hypothetical protein
MKKAEFRPKPGFDWINLELVRSRSPRIVFYDCKPAILLAADKSLRAHAALRTKLNQEARNNREASKPDCDPEVKRRAFVAKIKKHFPFVDVQWIADQIVPWDIEEFKRRVAERQKEYLKESKQ